MNIGYARVSTFDQNLDLQIQVLRKAGCKKISAKRSPALAGSGRSFSVCSISCVTPIRSLCGGLTV